MTYWSWTDEEEQPPQPVKQPERVGRTVQDLLDALQKVQDKTAIVTIKAYGNDREVYYLASIDDAPNYTTGPRTYINVN